MRAMVLDHPGSLLREAEVAAPAPSDHQVQVLVRACGVCRTDLHVVDGELREPKLPLIPGHQIVGSVSAVGSAVQRFAMGDRVGIPWLGWTCGTCRECRSGHENLCNLARFTGYTLDGGFAEMTVADERYCFPLPAEPSDLQTAPLLCAGLIGYRAYRMAGDAQVLGFYGFGAAAHILVQVAQYERRTVLAFTKPGDLRSQAFALEVGASWAGAVGDPLPQELDAAIIFAPSGALVPAALQATRPGGTVVCAGIHMSDIPSFPYEYLWREKVVRSVANLTRADGEEFLSIAHRIPIRTKVRRFALLDANEALATLRNGTLDGAAVIDLIPSGERATE